MADRFRELPFRRMIATEGLPLVTGHLLGIRLGVDPDPALRRYIGPSPLRGGSPIPQLEGMEDPRVALEPVGHETCETDPVSSPRLER